MSNDFSLVTERRDPDCFVSRDVEIALPVSIDRPLLQALLIHTCQVLLSGFPFCTSLKSAAFLASKIDDIRDRSRGRSILLSRRQHHLIPSPLTSHVSHQTTFNPQKGSLYPHVFSYLHRCLASINNHSKIRVQTHGRGLTTIIPPTPAREAISSRNGRQRHYSRT
jgi:hypothetical protein